jgi:fructuronate reductase
VSASARLSPATLRDLPASIERPGYEPAECRIGVVHLGPGAFHRAHQAWFWDDLLARDRRWAVSAVSLRSADLRDALTPQGGLYTVAVRDTEPRLRVIGALRECRVAAEDPAAALDRMCHPDIRVVSATVTEKGYCLGADGALDRTHPDIRHDLAHPDAPRSLVGMLAAALRRRRRLGLPPFLTLSCDNLADNGRLLRAAVLDHAATVDRADAAWIAGEARFPRSMVDSIVPATDAVLREQVAAALGAVDAWPVQREAWCQWVLEDDLGADAPELAAVGVTLTDDVAGYAACKLRLLNAAHSTLAYLGLLLGHRHVHAAMADPRLARHVEQLLTAEILPTLDPPRGLDPDRYVDGLLRRFRNPALPHALAQIAWDGSQKLPIRIGTTLIQARAEGRPFAALTLTLAAWLQSLRRQVRDDVAIVDPRAAQLAAIAAGCDGRSESDLERWFAIAPVFPPVLRSDRRFVDELARAYDRLEDGDPPLLR